MQKILEEMRHLILQSAPRIEEVMRYGIPMFRLLGKNLVHFARYKSHIGFYPTTSSIEPFKKEFSRYKTAKGSVQFTVNKPIPYVLIIAISKKSAIYPSGARTR